MGYRSEIYIKMLPKYEFKMHTLLAHLGFTWIKLVKKDSDYLYYRGSGLKWYNSYEDITAINSLVEEVEGCLVAIGEDGAHMIVGEPDDVGLEVYTETIIEGFYGE